MPSSGQSLPEGTVTVMCTDLVGSTPLNQRFGDVAATAIQREIGKRSSELVAKHGGAVFKDTGDGLIAAFQSARRAVTCAEEIQRALARRNRERPDAPVHLRIGLHTGEVLEHNGDLHGETVIISKRVQEVASSGAILASETVYGVLGTMRAQLQDRGEFDLKGIAAPWRLYEVPWAEETPGALPESESSPFVGRVAERARLRRLMERIRAGAGAFVLIAGDAGMGKTRLAHETAEEARHLGMLALTGHCLDMETVQPYLPVIEQIEQAGRVVSSDALRRALGDNAAEVAKLMPELRRRYPDIPEPVALPPEQERRFALHGVTAFVERAAAVQPLVLVFEDLHWADQSTLLLLRHFAQHLAKAPVFLIGTYRATDLEPGRPFGRMLEVFLRERLVEEILLRGLAQDDVSALLAGRAGSRPPPALTSVLYAETEGNPFFLEEVFRHLSEAGRLLDENGNWKPEVRVGETEVPRGVRMVLGRRIERVSEDCRRMLAVAAVIGKTFSFDLLAGVAQLDEDRLLDGLEQAERGNLVVEASTEREAQYTFTHEQIRQTLLGTFSMPRRQRVHLRIADAIEQSAGAQAEERAIEIAHHLYQAGTAAQGERTANYLVMAGERALQALAFEDALRNFDAARTLLPEQDRAAHARAVRYRALALRGTGRADQALAAFAEALKLASAGADRDAILYERADLQLDLFHGREATEDLQVLLAHARESGDRRLELDVMVDLARAQYILSLDDASFVQPTRESYDRTYALARELGDRRTMVKVLTLTTWLADYISGYREQAAQNVGEAASLADQLGDEGLRLECAMARLRLLAPGQAAAEVELVRERLKARRDPIRLKEYCFQLMWHYWIRAEFDRCIEVCDEGVALAAQLGSEPVQYSTIKALALMDLGRFDAAWDALQHEVADEQHPFGRAMRQLGVAVYMEHLGAIERAVSVGREVLNEAQRLSRTWMQEWMVNLLTALSARLGNQELQAHIDATLAACAFRPSELALAQRRLSEGNPGEALEFVAKVAHHAEANGLRREHIIALEAELRALGDLGRWAEMAQRADEALAEAEATKFQAIAWCIQSHRARARIEIGDCAGAARDTEVARQLLRALAATVPDADLRACLEADPAARRVLATTEPKGGTSDDRAS
jgi:class 3 adenylate cyclase/tetratricopeptide (TPR) repeat protein